MSPSRRPLRWACLLMAGLLAFEAGCSRAPRRDPLAGWPRTAETEAAEALPPLPAPSPLTEYAVVLVPAGETLPVRELASASGSEVARLSPDHRPVRVTGLTSLLGSSVWFEIELPDGGKGWTRAANLTEARTPEQACSDPRVMEVIHRFLWAGEAGDPAALRRTISPWRGLSIRLDSLGGEVHFEREALADLFEAQPPIDWQTRSEASVSVKGDFLTDVVRPLASAVAGVPAMCGELPAGQTATLPAWPTEFANLNFLAFHTPADPAESDFVWNTWAIGIDYAGGDPYVAVIIRFQGEI